MGMNGESGALGLGAARGGVELGVGARFARFGTGIGAGTSNVASEPLRDRDEQTRQRKHCPKTRRLVHNKPY